MKRLRRICLAMVMATGLSLITVGAVTASPAASPARNNSGAPAATCPPEGTRFQVPSQGNTVYLIGPKGWRYHILDEAQYHRLWRTWDGIQTGSLSCIVNASTMYATYLAKRPSEPHVYIYDTSFDPPCFRHIVDWDTFANKYKFDPEMIRVESVPAAYVCNHPWT